LEAWGIHLHLMSSSFIDYAEIIFILWNKNRENSLLLECWTHCKFTSWIQKQTTAIPFLHLFHQDKSTKHQKKWTESLHWYSIHKLVL
jgi:predicted acyl esterase